MYNTTRMNARRLRSVLAALALLILPGGAMVSGGCAAPEGEGFAIYFTKYDVPPQQMEALSHVEIAEQPVISMADIITYNEQTHELKLTADAFERASGLIVPINGRSFVVCVDKKPVYWGAFWTPISSISFDGVTIWKPYATGGPQLVTLELGYPSESFYDGEDPRNSPEVISSLLGAGKLVTRLTIDDIERLPAPMKGYELYSWPEGGTWRFTLITGTDHNKRVAEITSGDDFISEAGWIKISVAGAETLNNVLGKIPPGSSVFWLGRLREPGEQAGSGIQLPPPGVIDAVRQQAGNCGLEFSVAAS